MEKKKIYIIDDSENFKENLREILKENYELLGDTNDGLVGFDFICKNKVDLVIADIVLQNIDGFEFLEKLQEVDGLTKPKVLIVSSLKGEDFAEKAISLGANYYLIKPVINDVLIKRINTIVNNDDDKVFSSSTKRVKNRALDEKISNIFITVGIPAHIKGYQFLREAIKMAIDEPDIINSITKQLYPSIADRFSTSASKVERAIRHAIEVAWNRGKIENINSLFGIKVYNSNEKPTNGEFIALVADKMLIEGA